MQFSARGAFIVDHRGTILGFDEAIEQLTGWPACEIVGRDKQDCSSAAETSHQVALYEGSIERSAIGGTNRLLLRCADGRQLKVEVDILPLAGSESQMRVSVARVLSRSAGPGIRNVERLDSKTGLPPAEAFPTQLRNDLDAAAEAAQPLALVLADIDGLRNINRRFGEATGDLVLASIADILRVHIDDEARIYRLLDDDFAMLLPKAGRGAARQLAASVRSTVERFRFFEGEHRITMSLGAASFPADADTVDDLLERAQEALDEARALGRNRVWCYLKRPRVPLEVPVFFDGSESLLVGYTRDLSPSGIFVQTSAPIDVGMRCAFAFPLPGRDGKVRVIGRIVRTVASKLAAVDSTLVAGMGVEFERFSGGADRRAIESWIHRNEHTSSRPESQMTIPG
jgi:diguanylate cyclase (GGDEF)-like protein/PAS domain S-box-containing protein